ncbi:MAG: DUF5329 domain-containing protein [Desulfosarcina sp.]|nr:DUF5329 domain-containing protein [Desulfobacterales bacterium]
MRKQVGPGLIVLMTFMLPLVAFANQEQTGREIQHLIAYIAGSDCRFIRNGKAYGGDEARKHIQKKYEYARRRIKTTEDFIRYAATQSSMSGEPYRIRCGDQTVLCADWLWAELERFRQKD